jgi:hypothetical protein
LVTPGRSSASRAASTVAAHLPAQQPHDRAAQADAGGHQQEPPLGIHRLRVGKRPRPEVRREQAEQREPGQDADEARQDPGRGRAVLRLVGDQPDHAEHDEAGDARPLRPPRQQPERGEQQQHDDQHPGHQQRLVVPTDHLDQVLGHRSWRQPDHQLGDVGDRVAAQPEPGGGEVRRGEAAEAGQHPGQRPLRTRPHGSIVARA